jgi:predicted Rossmann-fold nucleotide-binding protein
VSPDELTTAFTSDEKNIIRRVIRFEDLPYDPFRMSLYTVEEMTEGYPGKTLDQRVIDHYNEHGKNMPDVHEALAQRIHDHAIDEALRRIVEPKAHAKKKLVGVMGGHATTRDTPDYLVVAQMSRLLVKAGFVVVTGGGPGVMEGANLGAYLARYEAQDVADAVNILKKYPSYDPKDDGYTTVAVEVRQKYRDSGESLAVPTWAYANEPTGQFSSAIGKYFANSIREDGLLALAEWGVVFAPGAAGTLQEIFQDTAHNSYQIFGFCAPMVFLNADFYTKRPSIFDVVQARAKADNPNWDDMIHVCSTANDVVDFIVRHPRRKKS